MAGVKIYGMERTRAFRALWVAVRRRWPMGRQSVHPGAVLPENRSICQTSEARAILMERLPPTCSAALRRRATPRGH